MNYQFFYSREVMYDRDIMMLQVVLYIEREGQIAAFSVHCCHPQAMAAILDPNVFTYALIYKFRLDKWLTR